MSAISWGPMPATGILLTAHCGICGYDFATAVPDEQTAARCGVDHRCGTAVIGPLWTLVLPPTARVRRPPLRRAA